ncbi:hypothetical protein SynBIOSU31_01319 [Synechococcus sp. BIOS-U3-1]|uniref:hypothetical protein n=1 Tax=Synechococcus sp. BIOS-U3-1 TaxID=1400865 RepID=UPI0016474811|nr:hypothetical protein [Synechococcus sp. BIOS-U3-1]QNI58196.1 hypothetical protein SynBIOSU31_01319 [Synechococcus sp. BIOS-U3-1]
MSELNTDYNNTELLDQELSFDELQEINGGLGPFSRHYPTNPHIDSLFRGLTIAKAVQENRKWLIW